MIQIEEISFSELTPPTHFEGNEFTDFFQLIVSTYGVPSFGEANPALFTCITFPFLFGVMFGDIGHGLILLTIGILMCQFADKLGPEGEPLR